MDKKPKFKKKKIFVRRLYTPHGLLYDGDDHKVYTPDEIDPKKHFIINKYETSDAIKYRQNHLSRMGFYKGKIDGIWGPETEKADSTFWEQTIEEKIIKHLKSI